MSTKITVLGVIAAAATTAGSIGDRLAIADQTRPDAPATSRIPAPPFYASEDLPIYYRFQYGGKAERVLKLRHHRALLYETGGTQRCLCLSRDFAAELADRRRDAVRRLPDNTGGRPTLGTTFQNLELFALIAGPHSTRNRFEHTTGYPDYPDDPSNLPPPPRIVRKIMRSLDTIWERRGDESKPIPGEGRAQCRGRGEKT